MENKNEKSFSPFLLLIGLLLGGILLFIWIKRRKSNDLALAQGGEDAENAVDVDVPDSINSRHEIMLNAIKKTPGISTSALQEVFPDVTDRTLRRDLNKLIDMGVIRKEGSTKSSKYYAI